MPKENNNYIDGVLEKYLEMCPIQFFATHDYKGEAKELDFRTWQDSETKRAKYKQNEIYKLIKQFLEAQEAKHQKQLQKIAEDVIWEFDERENMRGAVDPEEYDEACALNSKLRELKTYFQTIGINIK